MNTDDKKPMNGNQRMKKLLDDNPKLRPAVAEAKRLGDIDKQLDEIVGTFISLKFDIDTDDFSDGTLERWNNMKQSLHQLIQSEVVKELENLLEPSQEYVEKYTIKDRINSLEENK